VSISAGGRAGRLVLAAAAGTSARHLNRLFRQELGTRPGRYVELVRLEAAQALLDAGRTVTSAGARSGFGSDETLRRADHIRCYRAGMADRPGDAAQRDSELVRAAQAGDAASLGLLLTRHRAGMYAVALALLGQGADAEDAVQEAALLALCRIGDLRDPDAVGPWLRMVVRNTCRAQLRRVSAVPMAEPAEAVARAESTDSLDPGQLLEQHALRDWVWTALEGLSPGLRLVTLLRYFTEVSSYEDIAALCATPVGTVRSRLNQARTKLADALRTTANQPHGDATALSALHCGLGEQALSSAGHSGFASALSDLWSPQAQVTWPTGKLTGIDYLAEAYERDLDAGVRHKLVNVVASRDVVIWEDALLSPPEDPLHCPPGVAWAHFLDGGRVGRVRLYHPRRR
jgi:RNA polymerase sigma factor (sigma-70 family)